MFKKNVLYPFPEYALDVASKVKATNWLIHSFELDYSQDCYNPAGYLFNKEYYDVDYTIYLDLNIYQYVLSAYKKNKKNDLHRNAMSLMVFGKFTNIAFDPTFAIYEKLNYLKQCPDELVDDLRLFRQLDNADMDELAKFSLGYSDTITLPFIDLDPNSIKEGLIKYKRLKKWDSFYLMVLEIVKTYHLDKINNENKFINYLQWCFTYFGYSLVVTAFLILLLGKSKSKGLMKFKPDMALDERKKAIENMTWDLFLLDKFFETWVNKSDSQEFLYASNDKGLRQVLEIAISIQQYECCSHLTEVLSPRIIEEIESIPTKMKEIKGRKMSIANNFANYRRELIHQNEEILLTDS